MISSEMEYITIIDAKLSATAYSISEDIINYKDYCDHLEFWCLFGNRDTEKCDEKDIQFKTPNQILNLIQDKEVQNKLIAQLEGIKDGIKYVKKDRIWGTSQSPLTHCPTAARFRTDNTESNLVTRLITPES